MFLTSESHTTGTDKYLIAQNLLSQTIGTIPLIPFLTQKKNKSPHPPS